MDATTDLRPDHMSKGHTSQGQIAQGRIAENPLSQSLLLSSLPANDTPSPAAEAEDAAARTGGPCTEIDRRLGGCLKAVRLARGLSQQSVAEQLGLSAQQLQKYERGINRVSVATLLTLSRVLGVNPVNLLASLEAGTAEGTDQAMRERTLLFEYFSRLGTDRLRRQVLDLLAEMTTRAAA